MKALISVFIALLIVVVSHYAHANDVRVTRSQNGAKDPNVQVIKEEKKSSDKITAEDLKDFATKSFDNRVLTFRRGNQLITMTPFSDFWWSPQRKQIFEDTQVLAEKLSKEWLEQAFKIRFDGSQSAVEEELMKLTASEIRKQFAGQKIGGMPTRREIINAAGDAREAAKKLKEKAKFLVEFDELVSAFDQYQDENLADSFLAEKLTPSALMFISSVKLPAKILEGMRKTVYFKGLATVLDTSLTFTMTVRPWKVTKTNLDTQMTTDAATYYETSVQAWALKNIKTDAAEMKGPLRLGLGLLFGNFSKMSNVHGAALGGSYAFNFRKSMTPGSSGIPTHNQVKLGVIGAAVETLAGAVDLRNVAKHGYFTYTRQFGYSTPTGKKWNGDIGGIANFNAIANSFGSFDQKTINGIVETALKGTPGADVIIGKNQVEILIPEENFKPTPAKPETAPTPVNPVP